MKKVNYWSLCPYNKKWCFGREVGDIEKCRKCEIELKYVEELEMARHTKYIQNMLRDYDCGELIVVSPDKLVKICADKTYNGTRCTKVYHYDTLILTVFNDKSGVTPCKNGCSITLGENAYSQTDCRIINQVLENYHIELRAHWRKTNSIYLE